MNRKGSEMSAVSRRRFFSQLFRLNTRMPEAQTAMPHATTSSSSLLKTRYREELDVKCGAGSAPCWVPIGLLADFPPGTVVQVNNHKQLLRSLPEGLMACDVAGPDTGSARPLRLEQSGQIFLNPTAWWDSGTALSVMTGSPIRLQEEPT